MTTEFINKPLTPDEVFESAIHEEGHPSVPLIGLGEDSEYFFTGPGVERDAFAAALAAHLMTEWGTDRGVDVADMALRYVVCTPHRAGCEGTTDDEDKLDPEEQDALNGGNGPCVCNDLEWGFEWYAHDATSTTPGALAVLEWRYA